MYCKYCGVEIPEESRFCRGCGQPVNQSVHHNAKKRSKAPAVIALVAVLCLLMGAGGGFYYYKQVYSPQQRTGKAILLLSQGEYKNVPDLIADIDTVQARQLKRFCHVEELKDEFLIQLTQLKADTVVDEFDEVVNVRNPFKDEIFRIFFENQTSEYDLLPDVLKRKLIYYWLVCKMTEEGFMFSPDTTLEEADTYRNGPLNTLLYHIASYCVDKNSFYDAWGLNAKEVMQTETERFSDITVLSVFSEEYYIAAQSDSNAESQFYVYLDLSIRDMAYFLLKGEAIDRAS